MLTTLECLCKRNTHLIFTLQERDPKRAYERSHVFRNGFLAYELQLLPGLAHIRTAQRMRFTQAFNTAKRKSILNLQVANSPFLPSRFETIDAARNKLRVKGCYVMIVLTVVGCIGMVIQGKQVGHSYIYTCLSNAPHRLY